MAVFVVGPDQVELQLSLWEHVWTLHGNITFPRTAVRAARRVGDPWSELRGVRSPGTGVPRVLMFGTKRGKFGKDFVIVHRNRPAVLIDLEGQPFQRLIVQVDDPDAIARLLQPAV